MMFYAACIMGLVGSLHCLGMCGPIAFALPVHSTVMRIKLIKYGLYNIGRVFTYSLLGIVIGFAGKGLVITGMQQIVSVAAGVLMIITVGLTQTVFRITWFDKQTNWVRTKLKNAFQYYFQQKGYTALFMLGVLNGLLPCGMVYVAMLGALSTGSVISGAAFMAGFGLGTIPMMFAVCLVGNAISVKWKGLIYKAVPVMACLVGVLLILRGLQVTIPFVTPSHPCCDVSTAH